MTAKVNLTNDGVSYAVKGNFYEVDTNKSDYKYTYFLNGDEFRQCCKCPICGYEED